jgi:hypothetical protein
MILCSFVGSVLEARESRVVGVQETGQQRLVPVLQRHEKGFYCIYLGKRCAGESAVEPFQDLIGEVKRVAAFLGKSLSDDQLLEMQNQLSHNTMKVYKYFSM